MELEVGSGMDVAALGGGADDTVKLGSGVDGVTPGRGTGWMAW